MEECQAKIWSDMRMHDIIRKRWLTLRSIALNCLVTLALAAASSVEAGPTYGKAAVHVVPHGINCKTLSSLQYCSDIKTTYIGTGDIDVVPIFWDLYDYSCVEFGLDWPEDWGTCSFTACGGGSAAGTVVNPGDGIYCVWAPCRLGWVALCGYGWLTAQSDGMISMISHPDTRRIGVTDCDGQWYPPIGLASSGVGWVAGDNPCAMARDPLTVTITVKSADSCAAVGDTLEYLIHVENWTMQARHDIALLDSVPRGTAYLSGGTYSQEGNVVTWTIGTLESGQDSSVSFSVVVTDLDDDKVTDHCIISCREVWPMPASDTTLVCPGSAIQPTTWGSIKAIFR